MMLTIPLSQLGYVIAKARAYDAEVAPAEEAPSGVEHEHSILEATTDNPTRRELLAAIRGMNDDERIQLIALMWLGRGDAEAAEWRDLLRLAGERHNRRDAEYLAGTPMLGDYLEEGAAALGYPMERLEQ